LKVCLTKQKSVPQRLKPRCRRGTFGIHSAALRTGSEAVPLSKTDYQHTLKLWLTQVQKQCNCNSNSRSLRDDNKKGKGKSKGKGKGKGKGQQQIPTG
jgi:hypothetical protein